MHFVFEEDGFDDTDLDTCLRHELVVRLGLDGMAIDEGAIGLSEVAHEIATVAVGRDLNVVRSDSGGLDGDLCGRVGPDDDGFGAQLVLSEGAVGVGDDEFRHIPGGVRSGPLARELADAQDFRDDVRWSRKLALLKFRTVDGGCVERADAKNGCVEVIEAFFLDEAGDLSADPAEGFVFFDDDRAVCFANGVENGFFVERADGAQVEDFSVDIVFSGEKFCGMERGENGATVSDERDVGSFAFEVSDAERDGVLGVGHLPFFAVQQRVFHEHDGVIVTDGRFHQAFCVVGGGWADDFESGNVGEPVFRCVRVGGTDVGSSVGGASDDDGAVDEAAAHVADEAGVVNDLVPCDGGEAPEHEFHDGAQTEHGGTDAHADECGFADGRVADAFIAETFPEAFGDFVGAVVFGDFFAEEDDIGIALDFFGEGVAESFAVGDLRHGGVCG